MGKTTELNYAKKKAYCLILESHSPKISGLCLQSFGKATAKRNAPLTLYT